MRSWHRIVLAGAVLLSATVSSGAHAQGYRIGNRIIPESSIERPGDIGHRVHTRIQILAGPDGEPAIGSDGGLGPGGGLTPAQLRQAYNLPSAGGSQIIAIVDAYDDPNALNDFNTFSAQYGLPQELSANATASTNRVFQVLYGNNGVKPSVDSTGGWELEESLDIEWAHAMAPNAKIILVEALAPSYADLMAAEDAATSYTDGNGWKVKEVSNSWGGSEFSGENGYDSHFTSNGVAYFVSAGDDGAPAAYPSASPYVVSAGGTTVNTDNNGNFTNETAWSLSGGYGGGGGPSAFEARPAFQNGISGVVGSKRGTPDLSSAADPNTGASIYDSYPYGGTAYGWMYVGGTSWSSPTLAGIANLAAAAAGSFPAGTQALLTTVYSKLGTSNFRDITSGNNGYPAMVGWDFASGVGSCLGLAGLQASASGVSLSGVTLNPASVTGGASSQGTVTLSGAAPSGGVVVSLSSGNAQVATAPTSVTVLSGHTSAIFSVTTQSVAVSTQVSVLATYGSTTQTATLTVQPSASTPTLTALTVSPSTQTGGLTATGTVTLSSAAPSGGAVVSLSSSSSSVANVPASVTVAAGQTSAIFTVNTSAVAANTNVTITASYAGGNKTATLTVQPSAGKPTLTGLFVSPKTQKGGSNVTGDVNLSGAAPSGGIVVNLSSSSSVVGVPASVTVPAGQKFVFFTLTTSAVAANTNVTITASYAGVNQIATLTVTP